jgi:hypothetical protein
LIISSPLFKSKYAMNYGVAEGPNPMWVPPIFEEEKSGVNP